MLCDSELKVVTIRYITSRLFREEGFDGGDAFRGVAY